MARILFAAHDPGGANLLAPVIESCFAAGHEVRRLACGPAREIWPDAPAGDTESAGAELHALTPDLTVTGTSESADFEQRLWNAAREANLRSMAAIDAWMNLRERFTNGTTENQPDALLVIDTAMKGEIEEAGWCRARLHVGGQPHLERQAIRLRRLRKGRAPGKPRSIAYFSEPIEGTSAAKRVGYDQFRVAAMIATALTGRPPVRFLIRPHPKETTEPWTDWLSGEDVPPGVAAEIRNETADDLLATADAVISMASMPVIEAALAGIPALAVQPGRNYCPNPAIDASPGIRLVTEPEHLAEALGEVLARGDAPIDGAAAGGRFAGSAEACLRAIESELEAARR
jgi:hypothetical protein